MYYSKLIAKNRNTHQDDMTTDHEANVLGDAWCEIDQWRPILWEARQHQNLWPAYWLNHNLDISDSYNAYWPISYKTDWIVTYFFLIFRNFIV